MAWFQRRHSDIELTVHVELPALWQPQSSRLRPQREREDRQIIIPTDLMFASWRQLFPAERMMIFGGRRTSRGVRITSASDVTEPKPSAVHVRACPEKVSRTLIDFERAGAHFAIWMHSHPGEGPKATYPSGIDLNQDKELRQHYSDRLVGIIAVRDGWLRLWGPAVENSLVQARWQGQGIEADSGERHVYRLRFS